MADLGGNAILTKETKPGPEKPVITLSAPKKRGLELQVENFFSGVAFAGHVAMLQACKESFMFCVVKQSAWAAVTAAWRAFLAA